MKKISYLLILIFVGACSSEGNRVKEILGSDTLLDLVQSEAEAFYAKTKIPINVSGGGSGVGVNSLLEKQVTIANVSRKLTDEEKKQARSISIAKDLLMIVVNKNNKISNLTLKQLSDIYLGKTKNWKDLGGKDAPINLYGRQSSSGTAAFFQEAVLNKLDFNSSVKEMAGNPQLLKAVKGDENAIAYIGMGYVLKEKNNVNIVLLDNIDPQNEKNFSSYKLSRYLYEATLKEKPTKDMLKWFDFIFSPEGQQIVKKRGYIPLSKKEIASQKELLMLPFKK